MKTRRGREQQRKRCRRKPTMKRSGALILFVFLASSPLFADDWLQFKGDGRHSGNVPDRAVTTPLGLVGAVPLTDAIFTSPVVADGCIYAVDGSGVAFAIDAKTLAVLWKTATRGGAGNCNNLSSPAVVGKYLHFGTMAGFYVVLERATGKIVREIDCGDPIFSTPVAGNGRAYFVTLGSKAYAVEPDGK